jgi:hypothetical protein
MKPARNGDNTLRARKVSNVAQTHDEGYIQSIIFVLARIMPVGIYFSQSKSLKAALSKLTMKIRPTMLETKSPRPVKSSANLTLHRI